MQCPTHRHPTKNNENEQQKKCDTQEIIANCAFLHWNKPLSRSIKNATDREHENRS